MRTLKALALLAVAGAAVLPAAASAASAVRANIPFEFAVAGITLPAGNYQFEQQQNSRTMAVWNLDQRTSVLVLGTPAYARPLARVESRLVFNKYGNRYFLAEVWSAANAAGVRAVKSRQESEAAQKASAQTVLVAAR